jgi:hypothetical protein
MFTDQWLNEISSGTPLKLYDYVVIRLLRITGDKMAE